ncbi:hypothetical protein GKE82_06660 [Conexibacter sp. W3-3-2]|uniref:hypothetical protein n=1 Tax=Conexibacter sp. W3-3-2 TaxID=2675227 RepID=UPI0012B71522|nr:hypothetical protein [Conexibacter sp. W3-3-2]MTD43991.1 hypothetical protein [Conexibacter sp. W3-3-2]
MGSNAKKKTTMAKLQREQRKREKRLDKQARRASRPEPTEDAPDVEPEYYALRTAGREGFEDVIPPTGS